MKEWIAKYQKAIVGTGAVAVLVICYFQQKELAELRVKVQSIPPTVDTAYLGGGDIMKAQLIDSLQSELFNANNAVGRYELTLEHLKEVNPKAAKEFENFLNHETE